jgi:predicted ATPase
MVNDMDAATKHVTLLIKAATALDLTYWKTMARCLEGWLLVRQGNYEPGVSALRDSLAACDEAGGTSRYAGFLSIIAQGLAGLGRVDEARLTLDQALARAECDGEEWCIPSLLCAKGELVLCEPDPAAVLAATAEKCFRDAIELARTQGALLWELRGASQLARLRLEKKRPEDARQILAPVYGRFAEGFETPDLRAAKTLLDSLPVGQPL